MIHSQLLGVKRVAVTLEYIFNIEMGSYLFVIFIMKHIYSNIYQDISK